jgi:metal transporter CNNM
MDWNQINQLANSPVVLWVGVAFCLSQSAMFSGLNLAFFSLGRLRLEAVAEQGNEGARRILDLRRDSNFLLCTILWGNVAVNVALTLLLKAVFGAEGALMAFAFSTVGITFFGEIIPQAYFSRHVLNVASRLAPIIRIYQFLLYPLAKPSAFILDTWIGKEGPNYMRERDIEIILHKHINEVDSEIGETEGQGALNFLDLDDRKVISEGQEIDPDTIHAFPVKLDLPILPQYGEDGSDEFIEELKKNDKKWRIIVDEATGLPLLVLEAEAYVYSIFSEDDDLDIYEDCHRPIIVTDPSVTLDKVLDQLQVDAEHRDDLVVDDDVILFWSESSKRIITGADILGRLLKGIVRQTITDEKPTASPAPAIETSVEEASVIKG